MAGSTNFLQFDTSQTDLMSDANYANNALRSNGVSTGIANSTLHNKMYYQWSTMSAGIAGAMAAKGYTVSDSNLAALITVLGNIMTGADKGAANGVASLDANNHVVQNPASVAAANGIASLDANSHVIQEPASKGQANGIASLSANSLVVCNPANATATPAANKIPIADANGTLNSWVTATGNNAGKFIQTTVLTSASGNFTTNAATTKIKIRGVGGGGGGGGAQGSTGASNGAAGGGGGAGGYAEKVFTVVGNSAYTYTCGAGGAGGENNGTSGANGANSTFAVGNTTVIASFGWRGGGCTNTGDNAALRIVAAGDMSTISSNGDINTSGMSGGCGFTGDSMHISGYGGSSLLGCGGNQITPSANSSQNGVSGGGYGGGGSGAANYKNNAAGGVGGAGSKGCWIVDEFM